MTGETYRLSPGHLRARDSETCWPPSTGHRSALPPRITPGRRHRAPTEPSGRARAEQVLTPALSPIARPTSRSCCPQRWPGWDVHVPRSRAVFPGSCPGRQLWRFPATNSSFHSHPVPSTPKPELHPGQPDLGSAQPPSADQPNPARGERSGKPESKPTARLSRPQSHGCCQRRTLLPQGPHHRPAPLKGSGGAQQGNRHQAGRLRAAGFPLRGASVIP